MAMSTMATEVKLAKMALRALRNNNLAINMFYKDLDSEFKDTEAGGVVNIKKPIKFQSYEGIKAQIQPYSEATIPVKVDKTRGVAWSTNQIDMTLQKDPKKLYQSLVEPAMIEISTQMDLDLFKMVLDVHNSIGIAGTTPSTFLSIGQIAGRLTNIATPLKKRKLIIDPDAQVVLADALKGLFQPKMVEDYLKSMYLGGLAEFDVYVSSSLPRLTVGVPGGTPLINGANQTGTSIAIDGLAATGTYKKGDIITFATVYDIHPVTRQQHTYLKEFVVTADFTASGGAGNLNIEPAIITEGAYKNCSNAPANNDAIVHRTSSNCMNNIAFYPDAFCFVSVPIKLPDMEGVGYTETRDGLSVTVTKGWDVINYQMVYRVDVLYGKKTLYADQACRYLG